MENDNHCEECAGKAAARGERCLTCDGTGKLNKPGKALEKTSKKSSTKKR